MPRQDVPYGGAICRLRERIAEIWDELGKKLHSINGVEGDGQGNVVLRSDNAALTVTDDQLQHEIVLDLDTSQLPAADVNSVNGQTGVVALTADDIPSDNGDVQTDLDNLAAADGTLQGNINAEALARQNADSTLQTNINTISAGLPAAAAAAVAADPTIAQLSSDVLAIPGQLSKRTGAGDRAYTHNGSTQGDTEIVDGTTAATIPIRDANGRMQAADPASGATDKTLVTANWVSQTGAGAPNNLIHRTGTESKTGELIMVGPNNGTCYTIKANHIDYNNPASRNTPLIRFYDMNNVWIGYLYIHTTSSGTTELTAWVRNSDGSTKSVIVAGGDVI